MLAQKFLVLALMGTEWVIWLLLLLSVFSLGVILEKFWTLRIKRGNENKVRQKIGDALMKKNRKAIEDALLDEPSSSAEVTLKVIHMQDSGVNFEDSLSIVLSEEKVMLESRLALLGTLGANAPFIGLFGTVLGIIHAFHNLAMNAKGGPSIVMAGISEALVATALGLFVAIPAVAAYNYFVRYIRKIMVSSENFARLVAIACMNMAQKKN